MPMHSFYCECGERYQQNSLDNLICSKCGKDCYLDFGSKQVEFIPFEPYYDKVLRSWVTSFADQQRKMKNHRSYSHQEGLVAAQDDKVFLKECRDIRKDRLGYMRQQYGDNYVKHQMETNPAFRDKIRRTCGRVFSLSG